MCVCGGALCRQKHRAQTVGHTGLDAEPEERNALMGRHGRFGSLRFSLSVTFPFYLILKYFLPEKRVETLREGFDSADGVSRFFLLSRPTRRSSPRFALPVRNHKEKHQQLTKCILGNIHSLTRQTLKGLTCFFLFKRHPQKV